MNPVKWEFENWIKSRNQSIEKYTKYPYSYKVVEVNAMWEAWKACWEFKQYWKIK